MKKLEQIKRELLFESKTIKLPYLIITKINSYSDKELQEKTGLLIDAKFIREYIYIFLIKYNSNILRFLNDKDMYEIKEYHNTREKQRLYGSTRKSFDGKEKSIKPIIVNFLTKEKIIIQTSTAISSYTMKQNNLKSTQSRGYIINTEYISNPVSILLEQKKPLEIHQSIIKDKLDSIINSNSDIAKTQLLLNRKFSGLDRKMVLEYGSKLIGKNYKGKLFTEKTLNNHMIIFDYLINDGVMIPSISEKSGRVFTTYNKVPGWIRDLFMMDDEETKGLDIKASIPSILNMKYGGNEIDYNYFVSEFGWDYSYAKQQVLEFLFSSNHKSRRMKEVYSYFLENNKELLINISKRKEGKDKNKEFANELFKIESDMMNEIITELKQNNVYVYYIFDELIGKLDDLHLINSLMNEKLIKYNIKTIIK